MSGDTLINVATLIAALASAILSFMSWKIEGNRRIAEMRRLWIEDLRQHVAVFSALLFKNGHSELSDAERDEALQEHLYIQMMLNPERDPSNQHIELEAAIGQGLSSILGKRRGDGTDVQTVVDAARATFKDTWETVKSESR